MSKNKNLFDDIKTPSIKANLKFDFAEVQNTSVKKTFCCNASTMIDKKQK